MNNKHKKFKEEVKSEIYALLEAMHEVIIKNNTDTSELIEKIKKVVINDNPPYTSELFKLKNILESENIQEADKRMKISIYYARLCNIIQYSLKYCDQYGENEKKQIIEYYINNNCLQEINHLGLGYYFNVKYPKHKESFLYSTEYGKKSNWTNWIKKEREKNKIKENDVQLIFTACKTHINPKGDVNLKSMSKCFGVDLFKYMKLEENTDGEIYANLYIIKDALVNFIQLDEEKKSLQEYLMSDEFSENEPQFCIDFTNVRDNKAENYNNWSKNFLKECNLSELEVDSVKQIIDEEYEAYEEIVKDSVAILFLSNGREKNAKKAISSRVSPITDREVIVSDTLWEIQDRIDNAEMQDEQCYHFTFTEDEYIHLIYFYFMKYVEKKYDKKDCYVNNSKKLLTEIENLITSKEKISKIEKVKKIKNIHETIKEKIHSTTQSVNNIPQNIETVLNTINWENEKIPKDWSLDNIYHAKNKEEENLICNIIKCLCKNLAMKCGEL